jgi:hypothetical protein
LRQGLLSTWAQCLGFVVALSLAIISVALAAGPPDIAEREKPGQRIDALIRAFPQGLTAGQMEALLAVMVKLRHHRGAVHTLPFGQIKALTNYMRDWALMRLEFRVPPGTDLELVKRLIKNIGKELYADPEMGPSFIEPLKSQGVRRVEDNALVIGVKYIAKPGQQFLIRREAYHRIIKAFNENGIDLVGRGVVVKVEGADATNPALGAAAAEAIRSTKDEHGDRGNGASG